jgi:hypothetical protein
MKTHIETILKDRLHSLGWRKEPGPAIASKSYPTAVGYKTAWVYLKDFGPENDNFLLTGTYYSEGRNCLESTSRPVFKTAQDDKAVASLAEAFACEADAQISQTYAVKLNNFAKLQSLGEV